MPAVDDKNNATKDLTRKASRILRVKQSSHVTVIQSRWRGRMTRLAEVEKNKVVPEIVEEQSSSQKKLRRSGTTYTLVQKSFIATATAKLNRVPLKDVALAEFYVDSATNLPYSSTATRITARILGADMKQIGETSNATFSHPDSDYMSPSFNLYAGWRGTALNPAVTIVCRIDTLESPSLEARTVGYAALKLCVDEHGCQPTSRSSDPAYLNAGQFVLPIYYGRVPTDQGPLSQALIEGMVPVEGAFLSVRLFDLKAEKEYSTSADSKNPKGSHHALPAKLVRRYTDHLPQHPFSPVYSSPLSKRSVTSVLLNTIQQQLLEGKNNNSVGMPGLSGTLLTDVINERQIFSRERVILTQQIMHYVSSLFPPVSEMQYSVDPRYMLSYDHGCGAVLALDMLYNMPLRTKLIKAAQNATSVRAINQGLARPWEDKINMFKTVFRYLPGTAITDGGATDPANPNGGNNSNTQTGASAANSPMQQPAVILNTSSGGGNGDNSNKNGNYGTSMKRLQSDLNMMGSTPTMLAKRNASIRYIQNTKNNNACDAAENIVDDASVSLYLDSHEQSPYYTDDYSSTAGLTLNPKACILVVVTAVDVLTNSEVDIDAESNEGNTNKYKVSTPMPLVTQRSMLHKTVSFAESVEGQKKVKDKNRKLQGLIGIHIGHNDRKATWWGLLPVHGDCPITVHPPATNAPDVLETAAAESPAAGVVNHASFSLNSRLNGGINGMSSPAVAQTTPKLVKQFSTISSLGGSAHTLFTSALHSPHGKSSKQKLLDEEFNISNSNLNKPPPVKAPPKASFVNAGTHQIPLFEGLPPEEMINSGDPMGWLLEKLKVQNTRDRVFAQQKEPFLKQLFRKTWFGGSSSNNSTATNSPKSAVDGTVGADTDGGRRSTTVTTNNANERPNSAAGNNNNNRRASVKAKTDVTLSAGSCAFIRLVDSRLRYLDSKPMIRDTMKHINEKVLTNVLKASSSYTSDTTPTTPLTEGQSSTRPGTPAGTVDGNSTIEPRADEFDKTKFNVLCKRFSFNPVRQTSARTIREAIPRNIDPYLLIEEVNAKFDQSLFDDY